MTVREAYSEAKERLRRAGVQSPAFDAACLLEKNTGFRRHELPFAGSRPALENEGFAGFWADVARRERREPLQYILGEWEFMGLSFEVGEGVLVPRPDTELLAQTAIDHLKKYKNPAMLELCGGSGCVSIAAAKAVQGCRVTCLELSEQAIGYIGRNARRHGVQGAVHILQGDMLSPGAPAAFARGSFDAVVCNPPYIPTGDIPALEQEVSGYEPVLALDGGRDGLDFYRAAQGWLPLLRRGGLAAFEVGIGQAKDVARILLAGNALDGIFTLKDYGGVERVVGGYAV